MNRCIDLLVLLVLAMLPAAHASDSVGHALGEAYDLKSNELLYREIYCDNGKPDGKDVIYHNESGRTIALKRLDFSSGSITPSFVQHNLYSSEVIEVALREGEVSMAVLDAASYEPKKFNSARAGDKLPVVIDAGFDGYIRSNWDSLLAGEKKRFLFPFAERSKLVELRVKQSACSYPSETDQCFKLELSNWLLRMLVAPIELGYDPEDQRLRRYRGLSNIGDGKGNGSVVDIRYNYQNIPALACSAGGQTLSLGSRLPDLRSHAEVGDS